MEEAGEIRQKWDLVLIFYWGVSLTQGHTSELYCARSFQGYPTWPYLTHLNTRPKYCIWPYLGPRWKRWWDIFGNLNSRERWCRIFVGWGYLLILMVFVDIFIFVDILWYEDLNSGEQWCGRGRLPLLWNPAMENNSIDMNSTIYKVMECLKRSLIVKWQNAYSTIQVCRLSNA